MAPTKQFSFEQTVPVNNKWSKIPFSTDLEYSIDTSTVYYFDYTEDDLDIGHQFAANNKGSGDYDQYGNKILFSGEMDFIGRSSSTDPQYSLYPANAPMLDFTVVLHANKDATRKLIQSYDKADGAKWKAIGWSLDTVDRFNDTIISWPTILPLSLQPGFNYTFKAIIEIRPIYDVGIVGGSDLREWQSSWQTSFEKTPTSFDNQANVRLQITFERNVQVVQNRVIYSFFDFIGGIGSTIGLFSIGLILLKYWQKLTLSKAVLKKEENESSANPYVEKEEEKEAININHEPHGIQMEVLNINASE